MSIAPDFEALIELEPGPSRTAAMVAWFQGLFSGGGDVPVLVGGAAVELYTRGAYTTGDLDFVGMVSDSAAIQLRNAGFERRGQHWVHERAQLFIELPARTVEPASDPVYLQFEDLSILAICPEALVVDRLAAWKFWGSSIDGLNALLLLQSVGSRMNPRLTARLAREEGVEHERKRIIRFVKELKGERPGSREYEKWFRRKPGRD